MSLSVDQFGKSLVASGLLTAAEVKAFWSALPAGQRPQQGQALARLLIKQEKLTKFQAQQLLSGSRMPLVLGDYVLLEKIGAGGMGQVFKAQHRHMKRLVAIKLLPPTLTKDEAAVKRFRREVEAAAKLAHPNIVQAYDASVQRGVWYLVMEHIAGRDLADVVANQGPLPIARAVDYIRQAAKGLAFAHSKGVVHRDIKPANLLLDNDGAVKILDMGLARFDDAAAQAQDGLTQSGQVMGTVDYMAPEQAFDTRTADARADIYSLGCTLYRLLTGQNMYDGETIVQKLMAHQSKPIPTLAAVRAEVPAELIAVFERMVAKQPEDRYATMDEVETALATMDGLAPPGSATRAGDADSKLTSFLQAATSGEPAAARVTDAPRTQPVAPPAQPDNLSPTISISRSQVTTDPVSDRSIQVARQNTPRPAAAKRRPWWRQPVAMISAGTAVGLLLLALGIWGINHTKAPAPGPALGSPGPSQATPPPLAKAPFDAPTARSHQEAWANYLGAQVETTNSVGMKMILIPPGEFLMGSSDEQVEASLQVADQLRADQGTIDKFQSEQPQHQVVITKPFRMCATEITVGQFKKFSATGYLTEAEVAAKAVPPVAAGQPQPESIPTYLTSGFVVTDDSPAGFITWNDASAFCEWLSTQEQTTYRLPTEAEWEYACRAGTTTQYSFGDDVTLLGHYGWYDENSNRLPHPVGLKQSNAFGLFDMHGNLYEWCGDYHEENWYENSPSHDPQGPDQGYTRAIRGGYWFRNSLYTRSTFRSGHPPQYRNSYNGFRCVAELDVGPLPAETTSPSTAAPASDVGPTQ